MTYHVVYPWAILGMIPAVIVILIVLHKRFFAAKEESARADAQRKLMMATRILMVLAVMVAIAAPYTTHDTVLPGDYALKILVDNSTSMGLYNSAVAEQLRANLEQKIPVTVYTIASGDRSALGDGMINHMHGDDNLLLVSDAQTTHGKSFTDVLAFAGLLNTSVSAVALKPTYEDYAIIIEGPSESITGTDTTFYVTLTHVGSELRCDPTLSIDDKPVLLQAISSTEFSATTVLAEGYHSLTARVACNDYYPQNNLFYKTVHVLPKPRVLYLAKEGTTLGSLLDPLYSITKQDSLPKDLSEYTAVIIDNQKNEVLDPAVDQLSDYVLNGGGLLVIGGDSSFDRGNYLGSRFENMLPVKVGQAGKDGDLATNVIIVIDISESTGREFGAGSDSSRVDVEKALILGIVDGISLYDTVGAVAFNHKAYIIQKPGRLGDIEGNLTQRISALQDTGGTLVFAGLKQAQYLLESSLGSKNIILFSDGVDSIPEMSTELAKSFAKQGIKIYAVGVGEGPNRAFLQQLASETGGSYFEPSEAQKLNIIFGEDSKEEQPSAEDLQNLVLFNAEHFITKNLELTAKVTGYNQVVKKSTSQMLVSLGDGKPIITVWRYGLGRVAVLSTDNGKAWASELLGKPNSKLVVRSLNWAIGDPQKNLPVSIRTEDTFLGDASHITIKSDKRPVTDQVVLDQIDATTYRGSFVPKKAGFQAILNGVVAANEPLEYYSIGLNQDAFESIQVMGGKIFDPANPDEIVEFVKTVSRRQKTTPLYMRWPFIIACAVVLIAEIGLRRLLQSRRKE